MRIFNTCHKRDRKAIKVITEGVKLARAPTKGGLGVCIAANLCQLMYQREADVDRNKTWMQRPFKVIAIYKETIFFTRNGLPNRNRLLYFYLAAGNLFMR